VVYPVFLSKDFIGSVSTGLEIWSSGSMSQCLINKSIVAPIHCTIPQAGFELFFNVMVYTQQIHFKSVTLHLLARIIVLLNIKVNDLRVFILVPAYGNPIDSVGLSECILKQIQSFREMHFNLSEWMEYEQSTGSSSM
jgi:hypothetical protein